LILQRIYDNKERQEAEIRQSKLDWMIRYRCFLIKGQVKIMILVTGATGSNGTEILKLLAAQNVPVRAMVRQRDRAKDIAAPNVEIVEGDFDRPETLLDALSGVERAFLVTPSSDQVEMQQLAFVNAAKQNGVKQIVYLSQFDANVNSPVRFLRYHAAIEAAIQSSGMAYTFLRPNLFMQGILNFRSTIATQNAFYAAAGDAKVSAVDVRDIAEVAVAALTQTGHEGKIYNLTGSQALTHAQMAAHLSAAIDRQIAFVDVPPESMHKFLLDAKFPSWQADGLLEEYAHYRRNEAAEIGSGVKEAIGKEPRNFETFAHDYALMFD
jgi:uncharacterized protein YbjT (DUF2867 family)